MGLSRTLIEITGALVMAGLVPGHLVFVGTPLPMDRKKARRMTTAEQRVIQC
jgi:hypothetical protein